MTNLDLTEQLKTAVAQANRLRKQRDQLHAAIKSALVLWENDPQMPYGGVADNLRTVLQHTAPTLEDCHDQTAEAMTDALKKHLPDMLPVVVLQPE